MQRGADGPTSGSRRFGWNAAKDAGVPWGWVNGEPSPEEQERQSRRADADAAAVAKNRAEAEAITKLNRIVRSLPELQRLAEKLQLLRLSAVEVLENEDFNQKLKFFMKRADALRAARERGDF